QGDRLGHAVQREIAADLEAVLDRLDGGTFEAENGELLDVEEVGAAQVVVTLLVVGVDGFRLDGHGEGRPGGVVGIDGECAGEVVEPAVDPRQAQVGNLEIDAAVNGVNGVVVGGADRRSRHRRKQDCDDHETRKSLVHVPAPYIAIHV